MNTNISTSRGAATVVRDINEALARVAEQHGVEISSKVAADVVDGGFALLATVAPLSQGMLAAQLRDFVVAGAFFGLREEHYGAKVTLGRTEYFVGGFSPRARRPKILVKRISDGKEFVASPAEIVRALGLDGKKVVVSPELAAMIKHVELFPDCVGDGREQRVALDALEKLAEKQAGPIGKIVSFAVADGCALYLVTGEDGSRFTVKHIPYGDAYRYDGEIDGRIDERVVRNKLKFEAEMRAL